MHNSSEDNTSVFSFKSEGSRGHGSRISVVSGEENRKSSSDSKSKFQRVFRGAGIPYIVSNFQSVNTTAYIGDFPWDSHPDVGCL